MSDDIIRWGIIGCGDVCEVKSGPGFQKATGSALTAVMRRDSALAEDYARRHGVARWHSDADDLINDASVDAVYIATPPGSHLELARRVASAGKPCLVEKPMARNALECEAMRTAFGETPLFVAYYRRCLPRFQMVAELLPRLGKLRSVDYQLGKVAAGINEGLPWRVRAAHSGGGLFLDVGCHALDLIDHLLGPLNDVTGTAECRDHRYPEEDHVTLQWRHDGDIAGTAVFDFTAAEERDELQIVGESGSLTCAVFEEAEIRLETANGSERLTVPHPPHAHQPLIQSAVDELQGRGACPATAPAAGRTARVMDRVLDAYYGGRAREFWRDPTTWPGASAALPKP